MKKCIAAVVAILIAACGGSNEPESAMASEADAADVTVCSCISEPATTSARANACTELMDSMTPEEITTETMACRATSGVPEGGPDLCYCLQAINPDPSVAAKCQEIIPENMSPTEMAEKVAECSRQ